MTSVTSLASYNLENFADKLSFALQNSALGILITFSVLVLLFVVVKIVASVISGKQNKESSTAPAEKKEAPVAAPVPAAVPTPVAQSEDNGELIAAITAAISLMLEAEGKDPRGFRVVSFRRSSSRK
jgi:sodium pump decarboxylase gamma subunit